MRSDQTCDISYQLITYDLLRSVRPLLCFQKQNQSVVSLGTPVFSPLHLIINQSQQNSQFVIPAQDLFHILPSSTFVFTPSPTMRNASGLSSVVGPVYNIGAVLSVFLNILLIYLVFRKSHFQMGAYRYLMIINCVLEISYSLMDAFLVPVGDWF